MDGATRTTCPYCGVGCGVIARQSGDGKITVVGDPEHPANLGRLCSKGLTLAETLVPSGRLTHPSIGGERVTWEKATAHVAAKFSDAIKTHGPDSVALYVSGQLLTEDYYVANKFMKGFVGSANIDTNSRLCMASAVAGHRRAFGADVVPCNYTDLEEADLVVLVGSNTAWCHPVLFQRLLAAREKNGTKIVVVDPRRTATAECADLFLPARPQSDVALFNGLLRHLCLGGHTDTQFLSAHTSGLSEALVAAREWGVAAVSAATDLAPSDVEAFYALFARHAKTVTVFSMGVNQSSSGTDKVNAIINVHLATGRIGKSGTGPFSLTGQPNAMGGREVGGLANMLAAHMDIADPADRAAVQAHWRAPKMAEKSGLKAVELFNAVHDNRIKALWIMGTNPAVSLPDSGFVAEALKRCAFVAVSDVVAHTETTQYADVLLPAQGWGEKNGTVTNSERCISRQSTFMEPHGEARADWHIICDVAKAMGFDGFGYLSASDVFAEHVALTRCNNQGNRKLDLSAWTAADYDAMAPAQWGGTRPFSDGRFQTETGRARIVATPYVPEESTGLVLNTGRIRDQWHTMTRTGLVPKLFGHRAEPHVEIHPLDAARFGISAADVVDMSRNEVVVLARALVTDAVQPGQVFQPMHWSGPYARNALANANSQRVFDPLSGQPALKSSNVNVRRFDAAWHGFGISLQLPSVQAGYFALRPLAHGYSFECADKTLPDNWQELVSRLCGETAKFSVVQGSSPASFRCVSIQNGKLAFAFFADASPVVANRSWLQSVLGESVMALDVLAARPAKGAADKGPIICACMNVGKTEIRNYIEVHNPHTEQQLFDGTGAGTGCGSCRPEIRRMIHETPGRAQAAE